MALMLPFIEPSMRMLEEAVVRSHQIRCEMDTIKREFETSAASLHKKRASCLRRAEMPMSSLRDVDADLAELAPEIHDVVLPLDERFEAYADVKALNATRRDATPWGCCSGSMMLWWRLRTSW